MSINYMDKSITDKIEEAFSILSEKRRRHVIGVINTARELAIIYGADPEKAELAAKCHDLFRSKHMDTLNSLVERYGLDEKYKNDSNLSHGKIAAAFMEKELGISDEDVLNAVSYHTTGRAGMSLLEKIIFAADAMEPGRDYPGVDEIRELAPRNLDKACLLSLEGTIEFLTNHGYKLEDIDRDTMKAVEAFRTAEKES